MTTAAAIPDTSGDENGAPVLEGVTESLRATMLAIGATIATETGWLLWVCPHGIRHPVGHTFPVNLDSDHANRQHERRGDDYPVVRARCDGCCPAGARRLGLVPAEPASVTGVSDFEPSEMG